MIKLKDLISENILDLKWIVGYVDYTGKVHFKVVKKNDPMDTHNLIWPGPKHGKWRWEPNRPKHINTYNEPLNIEDEYNIWKVIDNYK